MFALLKVSAQDLDGRFVLALFALLAIIDLQYLVRAVANAANAFSAEQHQEELLHSSLF